MSVARRAARGKGGFGELATAAKTAAEVQGGGVVLFRRWPVDLLHRRRSARSMLRASLLAGASRLWKPHSSACAPKASMASSSLKDFALLGLWEPIAPPPPLLLLRSARPAAQARPRRAVAAVRKGGRRPSRKSRCPRARRPSHAPSSPQLHHALAHAFPRLRPRPRPRAPIQRKRPTLGRATQAWVASRNPCSRIQCTPCYLTYFVQKSED